MEHKLRLKLPPDKLSSTPTKNMGKEQSRQINYEVLLHLRCCTTRRSTTNSGLKLSKESQNTIAKLAYEHLLQAPEANQIVGTSSVGTCSSLLPNGVNKDLSYNNLLQDFALRKGYLLPTYYTESTGNFHPWTFITTVKVGRKVFHDMEAYTKKQAEMDAARAAYMAMTEGELSNNANHIL